MKGREVERKREGREKWENKSIGRESRRARGTSRLGERSSPSKAVISKRMTQPRRNEKKHK